MAIKIFTGFKFASSDLMTIHGWISEWRAELNSLHKNALARLYAEKTIDIFDDEAVTPGLHAGKCPLTYTLRDIADRQKKIRTAQERDPEVDFDFDIEIFPHHTGVYGMTVTERGEWRALWDNKQFIEDFSYWNNSDRPIEVSEVDWQLRADTWQEILGPGFFTPKSQAGFNAHCTVFSNFPALSEIVAAIPTFEDRTNTQAKRLVFGAEMRRRWDVAVAEALPGEAPDKFTVMWSNTVQVQQWMAEPEGANALEACRAKVKALMQRHITLADLTREIPTITEVLTNTE